MSDDDNAFAFERAVNQFEQAVSVSVTQSMLVYLYSGKLLRGPLFGEPASDSPPLWVRDNRLVIAACRRPAIPTRPRKQAKCRVDDPPPARLFSLGNERAPLASAPS